MKYAGIIQNQNGTYRAFLINAVGDENASRKLERIVFDLRTNWRQSWLVPIHAWEGLVERDPIARRHLRFLPADWRELPTVTHTSKTGTIGQTFVYSAEGEQIGAEVWKA
jgi:hypothetical protein